MIQLRPLDDTGPAVRRVVWSLWCWHSLPRSFSLSCNSNVVCPGRYLDLNVLHHGRSVNFTAGQIAQPRSQLTVYRVCPRQPSFCMYRTSRAIVLFLVFLPAFNSCFAVLPYGSGCDMVGNSMSYSTTAVWHGFIVYFFDGYTKNSFQDRNIPGSFNDTDLSRNLGT